MGRAVLKSLKESTLLTFFRVCSEWGLKLNKDFKYNAIDGTIKWANGSEIYLKDLFAYPSDPEFDELGSTEFTGAFLDEASQISQKAYNIVMSRLRYKLDEFKIKPKLLTATNPTKTFLYYEFYMPWKEGTLKPYRKFVPALVTDNPYISRHYIENLDKLDEVSKQRLKYGNWEYDEDLSRLFDYEKILKMFRITPMTFKPLRYMTVDVARYGDDKTVILVWYGYYVEKIYVYGHNSTKQTRLNIEAIQKQFNIAKINVIVDEDGVGGGVVDEGGFRGFVNNSSPIEKQGQKIHNYQNLKSQCYYLLAEMVNTEKIGVYPDIPIELKKLIIEDLEQIKRHNPDKDGKLAVTPKEDIKEILGRSTDIGDALMMRMFFELKRPYIPHIA